MMSTDWTEANFRAAAVKLSELLTSAKSHGAMKPDRSESAFFDSTQVSLPQTDFSDLNQKLEELNPRLKTFSADLRQSSSCGEAKDLVARSQALKDLLSLDQDTLKAADQALTLCEGYIFIDPNDKPILDLINKGRIFFDRASEISRRLNALTAEPITSNKPTSSKSS